MGGFCLLEDNDTAFWDCGDYVDCLYAAPLSAKALACDNAGDNCAGTYTAGSDDAKRCALKATTLNDVLLTKNNICGPTTTVNVSSGAPTAACAALSSTTPTDATYPIVEENRGGPINVYWNR